MIRFRHLAAPVILLGVVGCAGPAPDGTARMADTLATLYARAVANPMSNQFLNRERADTIFFNNVSSVIAATIACAGSVVAISSWPWRLPNSLIAKACETWKRACTR
jgi:hypothetical protein